MARLILETEPISIDRHGLAYVIYTHIEGTGGGVFLPDEEDDEQAYWMLDVADAEIIRDNIIKGHDPNDVAFGNTTYGDVTTWIDALVKTTKERKKSNPGTIEIMW